MKSERISLDTLLKAGADAPVVESLCKRINDGAVFVYPTETIYGIGGSLDEGVRQRIIAAKQRDPENRFILLAPTFRLFEPLGCRITPEMTLLSSAFWPGNLTLVVMSGMQQQTVAIRVSDHPFLGLLAPYLEQPLYSTSANSSGVPYVNDPDLIFSRFDNEIDFMIDAGVLPPSAPSTVVDVSIAGEPRIVREGCIAAAAIKQALAKGIQD